MGCLPVGANVGTGAPLPPLSANQSAERQPGVRRRGFSVANPAGSTAPLVTSLALWCLWQPQSQIIAPQFNSTSLRRQLHQVSSLLKHGRATYSSCYSCQGRAGAKNALAAGRQPAVQPIGLHATVCKDQSATSVVFLTHRNLSESAPDFDFIARWARTYAAGRHFLNKNSYICLHFHLLSNWPFHSGAWALSRMPLCVTVERQQCHYRNENEFCPGGSIMHSKRNQCQRFLTPHLYSCQTKSWVTAWHPWDTFHINWSKWLDNNDNIAVTKVKHHELIELSQDHLPT